MAKDNKRGARIRITNAAGVEQEVSQTLWDSIDNKGKMKVVSSTNAPEEVKKSEKEPKKSEK